MTVPATPTARRISFRQAPGEFLFAIATLALGVGVLIGAGSIRIPPGTVSAMGPRSFPYFVGGILTIAAALVLLELFRGKRGEAEEGEDIDPNAATDWRALLIIVALFLGHAALIGVLGWPIAVTILFAGTAWALGTKKWWHGLLWGFAVALLVQFLFGHLLGLSLPAGVLLQWVPFLHA